MKKWIIVTVLALVVMPLAFLVLTSYGRANIAGPHGYSLTYLR